MSKRLTVTNLHGDTYEIRGWRLHTSFPHFDVLHKSMNRDVTRKESAIFLQTIKGKWYMAKHSEVYNLWIFYRLKHSSYNELWDLRKSYLKGNKYHA